MRLRPILRPSVSSLAFLASCLPACFGPPQWTGSTAVVEGVEVVSNPATPLLEETDGIVSELWAVQGSGWLDPSRVHVRSGLVTLVDPTANQIHLVSASGELRPSLGRPGGGPGEFLHLVDGFQDGDTIAALDGGKGTVEYLDREGHYLSSIRLIGQPWNGFPLGGGTLLVKGEFLADPTRETLGDWVTVRPGEDPKAFTTLALEPLAEEEGVQCSDLSAWEEGAARFRYTTPQIQLFDSSGALVREAWIDLPVEAVSSDEREAALNRLRQELASRRLPPEYVQQSLVVMEQRWRVKCRFGPLRFDATRRLAGFLEQNPDDFGSGTATLHFLSFDGVYLAKALFSTPWVDFAMDDGVVYALSRHPVTDVVTLQAFRVDLPGSLLAEAARALEEAR